MQHLFQYGRKEDKASIIKSLKGSILNLSTQKFASNVVEKCLECASEIELTGIINEIVGDENDLYV